MFRFDIKRLLPNLLVAGLVLLPVSAVAQQVIDPSWTATSGTDCPAGGWFNYEVTVGSENGPRNFQVKDLGDGTGGTAETYYLPDGSTGAPGQILVFATIGPGEVGVLILTGLPAGNFRITVNGSQAIKQQYQYDFTIDPCPEPTTTTLGTTTTTLGSTTTTLGSTTTTTLGTTTTTIVDTTTTPQGGVSPGGDSTTSSQAAGGDTLPFTGDDGSNVLALVGSILLGSGLIVLAVRGRRMSSD